MGDTGQIAELLADRDGVITIREALACGLTRKQIRGRVARGEWVTIVRGIYRSASHPMTEALLVRAAVAAHRGVADRSTAAWWHGMIRTLPYPLTVASASNPGATRWPLGRVDLIRRRYDDTDVETVNGLPVTSAPVTAVFAAATLHHGARFLDRVLQEGTVTVAQLQAVLVRYEGSAGIAAARRLVAVASEGSESEAGLPPPARRPLPRRPRQVQRPRRCRMAQEGLHLARPDGATGGGHRGDRRHAERRDRGRLKK